QQAGEEASDPVVGDRVDRKGEHERDDVDDDAVDQPSEEANDQAARLLTAWGPISAGLAVRAGLGLEITACHVANVPLSAESTSGLTRVLLRGRSLPRNVIQVSSGGGGAASPACGRCPQTRPRVRGRCLPIRGPARA